MFKKIFLLLLLFLPLFCFGYENLPETPTDLNSFSQWFFSSIPVKGAGWIVITGFVLTLLVGITKLTPLKAIFDKLGSWKFVLIMILGALAELIINFPTPFTLAGFLNIVATGALGTGSVSIAFHHILNGFANKK